MCPTRHPAFPFHQCEHDVDGANRAIPSRQISGKGGMNPFASNRLALGLSSCSSSSTGMWMKPSQILSVIRARTHVSGFQK